MHEKQQQEQKISACTKGRRKTGVEVETIMDGLLLSNALASPHRTAGLNLAPAICGTVEQAPIFPLLTGNSPDTHSYQGFYTNHLHQVQESSLFLPLCPTQLHLRHIWSSTGASLFTVSSFSGVSRLCRHLPQICLESLVLSFWWMLLNQISHGTSWRAEQMNPSSCNAISLHLCCFFRNFVSFIMAPKHKSDSSS